MISKIISIFKDRFYIIIIIKIKTELVNLFLEFNNDKGKSSEYRHLPN